MKFGLYYFSNLYNSILNTGNQLFNNVFFYAKQFGFFRDRLADIWRAGNSWRASRRWRESENI